jgi:prepilin-type N-terminal cleavage/methylation domain-containing protein
MRRTISSNHGANVSAGTRAFTLIELLVVVGIMALLATLMFPTISAINRHRIQKRLRVELDQITTAISLYRDKQGCYPPDNPANSAINPLYFELLGTTLTNGTYMTLDGSAQIAQKSVNAAPPAGFGPGVSGFMNSSAGQAGDDRPAAKNFLIGLNPAQIGEMAPGVKLLMGSTPLPAGAASPTPNPALAPWCYNSSTPAHNPQSYDLWVDVVIGAKTYRICNWSEQPLIVR